MFLNTNVRKMCIPGGFNHNTFFVCTSCHSVEGKLNVNWYFCAVQFLWYICFNLGLFLVSLQSEAANPRAIQGQEIKKEHNLKPLPAKETIRLFFADGKDRLHCPTRNTSPLKRHVSSGCLPYLFSLTQQSLGHVSNSIAQSRRDYTPFSLLLLFPQHNFW